MDFEAKIYRCEECGNIVELIEDGGGELVCCGAPMVLLNANTTDAATEKHVPVCKREGNNLRVEVGSVPHPMTEKHYIQWIMVVQKGRIQRVELSPDQDPAADFIVDVGPAVVYEYCNLHGLWKADVE